MNAKLLATALAVTLLSTGGTALAEGNAQAGKTKAAVCGACHGADGNSVNPIWPTLAGQNASYIVKQLKAFKAGKRQNPTMAPMAMPLSEQDMEDVAAYFSSQTPHGLEADKSKVEAGQKLYRGGDAATNVPACLACHSPDGRGNLPAAYPALRSQHAEYVLAQLKAYKSGERTTDAVNNKMMEDIASRLTDEQMAAVASYVQGLR